MEEMKTVAEVIQSLGGDAKMAFIVWIIATKLVDLAWVAVTAGALWMLFSRVSKGLYNMLHTKEN